MCFFFSEDTFDPVIIADKLRTVADSLNADAQFKAALGDLKQAVAQEVQSVKIICVLLTLYNSYCFLLLCPCAVGTILFPLSGSLKVDLISFYFNGIHGIRGYVHFYE